MLKLKRVEIQGFKSFYDRTEMKFNGSGIAAVVGPNGCGKSNLSDAISWVLGEQSAKSLRGSRMEDVIFAGTRDRKALGMASVTMTLVPDERALASVRSHEHPSPQPAAAHLNGSAGEAHSHAEHAPLKTEAVKTAERSGEITITRRLYRSGESEYLINGRTARLRDIQDLFLGTGLGPESYAIIEQGRIGQILSNKPQDRRNVIEEAAGVTKFKTRKRLAEAKLENAKQNLSRVFDILEEVTRQVNSLKRQAAKTRRYGELKAEATAYLRQVLAARFRMLERETAKIAIELNLASAALEEVQGAITTRETDQTGVLEASYANEEQLTASRQQLADLQLEAERARGQLEYQLKQIQQIDQRLDSGAQEAQALDAQQQKRIVELQDQTAELGTLANDCEGARQRLEVKSGERQQSQDRLAEHERNLEGARQEVILLLGEASGLKNRLTHIDAQLASVDRDAARAASEEQQSVSDLSRLEQVKAELSERLAARQTELISLTDQRNTLQEDLQEKRATLNESRQALDRMQSDYSRIKARKDSLEEVILHRSYTTETVKRLFTAVERGKAQDLHPIGVLADFLDVDPQLEKAVEEFLHDELEYVVVRDWAEADHGIELMRGEMEGRATFLVEDVLESAGFTSELPRPAIQAGALTPLSDSLRFTNGVANIPLDLLPRISYCYVANDRSIARQMAVQFPHCWFLSTDGVNYHGQSVSGGKKSGAGPLALKRELRDLSQLEKQKRNELESAQKNLAELERNIAKLAEELERVRAQQQTQEKDVLALDHETRKLAEEFQRSQSRLSRARLELDTLSKDRVQLRENAERDRGALQMCEERRLGKEQALESAREQLSGLQLEVSRNTEEHSSVRAELASLEERRRSLAEHCSRIESQVREAAQRQAHLAQETERLSTERGHLVDSNVQLETKSAELKNSIGATEADVNGLAERETELRARLAALDEELRELRQRAQTSQERRSELQVSLARAESDLKHLEETCQSELGTTLAQLIEGAETIADDATLQDIDAKYAEVRRKIEALGPVNPQALEEYEEAQQRQDFLSAQRQDLLDSIRDTEKLIHEIDGESRKRFSEAFHAINANFRELFNTLFGGGIGEMRLNDEENVAESGIDIVASPPGKKLQSILLLSGGEKSLTAMALLMAIFQYTPSPFCVLDEVDAPLDEPNIERLTRLLRDMADQTQFIVITHAKRTMEAAQALYGVTMQEPGISKLVSVKFNQNGEARQLRLDTSAEKPRDLEAAIA
ncbi:MAG TPA: chromosome segregation protein SMC [Bryobacteraceae bacterium]|nr:chromosome segregation protein SMC [Bryobacteraceae bacterium]